MRNYVFGGLALILAAMAAPTTAEALTADCNTDPSGALGNALAVAVPGDVIEVEGTCTQSVEIRTDDLTILGVGGDDTIEGQVYVIAARRVTIQDLTVQGNGTPGLHGIAVVDNAAATIRNVTVQNITEHGITLAGGASALLDNVTVRVAAHGVVALGSSHIEAFNGLLVEQAVNSGIDLARGSSAVLDQVTVRQSGSFGVSAQGNSLVEVHNGSLIEDNVVGGIVLDLGSTGIVTNSTIQNNGETGIHVFRGSSAVIEGNTIEGSPEGISLNTHAIGWLSGNTISTSVSDDSNALGLSRGSSAEMRGGNTLTSDGLALFLQLGSTLNQRSGDVVHGPTLIRSFSNAELRNISIAGTVEVEDHSLLRVKDQSGSPGHVSVTGNTRLSLDSGLNFLKDAGEQRVRVVGNITCADDESSLFGPPSNLSITGNKNCTGYNN